MKGPAEISKGYQEHKMEVFKITSFSSSLVQPFLKTINSVPPSLLRYIQLQRPIEITCLNLSDPKDNCQSLGRTILLKT